MEKAKKGIIITVSAICIALLVYFIFFFGDSASKYDSEVVTSAKKSYTITFDTNSLEYKDGVNFMQGVTATGEDNEDLTSYVTVSCSPTSDLYLKELSYSINKSGYEIKSFKRDLIIPKRYNGPSIKVEDGEIKIPIDKVSDLTNEIIKSGKIITNDGFGNTCGITAVINDDNIQVGDYVAVITAENILGDTTTSKVSVSIVEAETSIIKLNATAITLNVTDEFDPAEYVKSAITDEYGDVKNSVVCVTDFNANEEGNFKLEYRIQGIPELKDEVAYLNVTVKK